LQKVGVLTDEVWPFCVTGGRRMGGGEGGEEERKTREDRGKAVIQWKKTVWKKG